jgi:hypothetical protein
MTRVEMNHGRWIAQCQCGSSEQVHDGQGQVRCRSEYGGCDRKIKLQWPDGWQEIDRIVADRPMPNRNWRWGEPLEQLVAENVIAGDVVRELPPETPSGLIVVRGKVDPDVALDLLDTDLVLRFDDEHDTTEIEALGQTDTQLEQVLKKHHKRVR